MIPPGEYSREEAEADRAADEWADLFDRELERVPVLRDTPMNELTTAEILLIAHAALRDGDAEEVLDLIYAAWRQAWSPHDDLPPFFSGGD